MSHRIAQIGDLTCGLGHPLFLIAGPCVLETQQGAFEIADHLKTLTQELGIPFIFKASFDKANRTSLSSYRGPGLEKGLSILDSIKTKLNLPVTTDIHEPAQAAPASKVCCLLQIPAFLARQTDLLIAAAKTGRAVHVKKGQFLAPWDMQFVLNKLKESGCQDVLLCERGTFFGYGRLVNDMRALVQMQQLNAPVVFDATHSVQEPGGPTGKTGGQREMVLPLAKAAIAIGVDGLFMETHPNPDRSPSDGANMLPLDEMEVVLRALLRIREVSLE
ncbi:MAG: 3-deoxy-8-phosphooctulonate synthase [Pirellulaceae bacterium]|nr:3-deoxy-8-phosphooctulonate synthase [Pirellulaceae bacterium]